MRKYALFLLAVLCISLFAPAAFAQGRPEAADPQRIGLPSQLVFRWPLLPPVGLSVREWQRLMLAKVWLGIRERKRRFVSL